MASSSRFPVNHMLTFEELCLFLRISRRIGQRLHRNGEAPPHVMIGKRRRYPIAGVNRWLEERAYAPIEAHRAA